MIDASRILKPASLGNKTPHCLSPSFSDKMPAAAAETALSATTPQLTLPQLAAAMVACAGAGAVTTALLLRNSSSRGSTSVSARSSFVDSGDPNSSVHAHCRQKIAAERAGRTKAEKQLRETIRRGLLGNSDPNLQTPELNTATPPPPSLQITIPAPVTNPVPPPSFGYPALPIGRVQSPYTDRRGAPRQGALAPDARARIVFNQAVPATALEGLEGFSHVYVLFLFHENTDLHRLGGQADSSVSAALRNRIRRPLVEPPGLGGARVGVFASRSPHRPNAIGLSLCRLVSVDRGGDGRPRAIGLAGCDLLDGTPVFDIKPYAPYDCPTCVGSLLRGDAGHSMITYDPPRDLAHALWARDHVVDLGPSERLRVPDWVLVPLRSQAISRLPVVWGPGTVEAVAEAVDGDELLYYQSSMSGRWSPDSPAEDRDFEYRLPDETRTMLRALSQVLSLDVRAVHQGRLGAPLVKTPATPTGTGPAQSYEINFDRLHLVFEFRKGTEDEAYKGTYVYVVTVEMRKGKEVSTVRDFEDGEDGQNSNVDDIDL